MSDYNYDECVIVFEGEQYNGDWPPKEPDGFIAWFKERIDQIPVAYRATATIEIGSRSSYEDSSYANIEIVYRRPPTKEEIDKRKNEDEQRRSQEIAWAEQRLAHLKSQVR